MSRSTYLRLALAGASVMAAVCLQAPFALAQSLPSPESLGQNEVPAEVQNALSAQVLALQAQDPANDERVQALQGLSPAAGRSKRVYINQNHPFATEIEPEIVQPTPQKVY